MTDEDKGTVRAQGALANFLADMVNEVNQKSPDYRRGFWREMSRLANTDLGDLAND